MSLDYVQRTVTYAMRPGIAVFATICILPLKIPTNPSEIVTVDDSGFRVNVNRMEPHTPYLVEFIDSRYLIWKTKDEALVMTEV